MATECPAFSAVVACRKDFNPFCFKCRFSQITKMILSELAIQKVTALTRSYAILPKAHQGLPAHVRCPRVDFEIRTACQQPKLVVPNRSKARFMVASEAYPCPRPLGRFWVARYGVTGALSRRRGSILIPASLLAEWAMALYQKSE